MGPGRPRPWALPLAVLLTGLVSGLVGAALTLLLHLAQHLAFGYAHGSFLDGVSGVAPWRRVVGAAVVGLVTGLAWWWQRARHPAPSLSSVVRADRPRMPLLGTLLDAAVQIVAVAGGASVGREGAPRQSAAALATVVGERLALSPGSRRLLVACGAGAGLAAVYNVPVTGVAFAAETLAGPLGLVGVLAAAVSSLVATVVAWPVVGDHPVYPLGAVPADGVWWWAPCAAVVCGCAGAALRRGTDAARSRQPAPGPRLAVTVLLAMTAMGVVLAGRPGLGGNGKALLEATFSSGGAPGVLVLEALAKGLLTALCLWAGVKGGLLTPALSVGGALGGAAAVLAPAAGLAASPVAFVVVGMAAALVASRRAPLVGILLALELTHPPVPVMAAAALAGLLSWGLGVGIRRLR